MKHSKLPWKIDENPDLPIGIIIDDQDGEGICEFDFNLHCPGARETTQANAQFIVKACNEHDTLQAKADLFDEIVACLKIAYDKSDFCFCYEGEAEEDRRIRAALTKAKELK